MQPPLDAIEQVLSTERIEAFRRSGDADMDVMARYAWNMALCASLYPALHALEVVLRNRLFTVVEDGYAKQTRTFNDIECWLDCDPPLLMTGDLSLVSEAKTSLVDQGKDLTVGRLVAELSFGFWTRLFSRPYEQILWPRYLRPLFPNMPRYMRTREEAYKALDEARELRNRVFHHEPIFFQLQGKHNRLLRTLGWISARCEAVVTSFDEVQEVFAAGHEPFRQRLTEGLASPE